MKNVRYGRGQGFSRPVPNYKAPSPMWDVFKKGKALVMFFVGGVPDLKRSAEILEKLPGLGCNIVEIGVPFSDPLADGPVIRSAYQEGLEKGVTLTKILKMIKNSGKKVKIPVVLLIYYNLIKQRGESRFLNDLTASGVSGVIVPDLFFPSSVPFARLCRKNGIAFIPLVSPRTPVSRAREISKEGGGFLYYVNVEGVTGERDALPEGLARRLARVRSVSKLPVCCGFGISRPGQVRAIKDTVDGVIIGSAFQKRISSGGKIYEFVRELKCSL